MKIGSKGMVAVIIVEAIVVVAAVLSYGEWQFERGFNRGADTAICAIAIAMDGDSAKTKFTACRNIRDHSHLIDGLDRKGAAQ